MAQQQDDTLSKAERDAVKQLAAERRRQSSRKGADKQAKDLQDALDAIAKLPDAERRVAERLHEVITSAAPELHPKTWYGFPSYALDGKVLAFYQPAAKFDTRYGTLGFNDVAQLDDGTMWPTHFAITELSKAQEQQIAALVTRAVGR